MLRRTLLTLLCLPLLALAQPPDTLWTRTLGGPGYDELLDIEALPDGSFVGAGISEYQTGFRTGLIVRLTAAGDTLWTQALHDSAIGVVWSVKPLPGGGLLFCGGPSPYSGPPMVGRLDAQGQVLWIGRYPQLATNAATDLELTSGGGCYVVGTRLYGPITQDAAIAKLDSVGTLEWFVRLGGYAEEALDAVELTADGGAIAVGMELVDAAHPQQFYLVRVSPAGDTLWTRTHGGPTNSWAHSVARTPDGGFLVAGEQGQAEINRTDVRLLRTDSLGSVIWDRTFGGPDHDNAYSLVAVGDSQFVVAGYTYHEAAGLNDAWLLAVDLAGEVLWERRYGDASAQYASSLVWLGGDEFAFAGGTFVSAANRDGWVVRLGDTLSSGVDEQTPLPDFGLRVYPNPFNATTTLRFSLTVPSEVQLTLYDVLGREVMARDLGRLAAGEHAEPVDAEGLASGIYFVSLRAGTHRIVSKVALVW